MLMGTVDWKDAAGWMISEVVFAGCEQARHANKFSTVHFITTFSVIWRYNELAPTGYAPGMRVTVVLYSRKKSFVLFNLPRRKVIGLLMLFGGDSPLGNLSSPNPV